MSLKLLVALDESPAAWAALEHAVTTYADAEFVIIHVIDTTNTLGYGEGMGLPIHTQVAEESASNLLAEAQDFADEHDAAVTTTIQHGAPARTITACAEEHGVDRIIMGTHGRTGIKRILQGSVAERVVRCSSMPVTIVR